MSTQASHTAHKDVRIAAAIFQQEQMDCALKSRIDFRTIIHGSYSNGKVTLHDMQDFTLVVHVARRKKSKGWWLPLE